MQVSVVNMIPSTLSGETNRDSEPNLSVDPSNPLRIAGSAFTPDPASSGSGPIFVSTDGGQTWSLNVILPGGNRTVDITLRHATNSGVLYLGILRYDTLFMDILRKPDFIAAGLATTLVEKTNDDQPWVTAATVLGGPSGVGNDRSYVGENDSAVAPKTATVVLSLDAATAPAPAGFDSHVIDAGTTGVRDGPPIRPAIHLNGTIYAAFHRWTAMGAATNTADIVVVRDDLWAAGGTLFTALVGVGGVAGVQVVAGVQIPALSTNLGNQRIGGHLAIAVDPRDSQTVYLAWADGPDAAGYTLHLRRSIDGGATWTGDLRTISQAVNPGLAITIRGTVGFLYQQLGNPGTGNRWRTHVELSDDGFATAPTDVFLADVPDNKGPNYFASNPIGDYACLVAQGKDLYGIFSGFNTADNANFPNNVAYQRFADFGTHQLFADAPHTTTVLDSIDPFFFHITEVAPADDFYVRDWTDSPASGDTGLEPSTHPVFYHTSDVWNRRGTLPGPFPSDQPDNEDAGNGSGIVGDNWAFARIRRNTPAAGAQTVTAHFLVSKFGTGSSYVDAGSMDPDVTFLDPDPPVVFNAADVGPFVTPAYHWHLNAISSIHLCLAVEISSPNDPFVPPSLLGNTPGWPNTDLRVILDNNKAQRNMGLSTTPARGVGASDTFYAIVRNGATFTRDMQIAYQVDPAIYERLKGARIEVPGGPRAQTLRQQGQLVLEGMLPGENRWIGLTFRPPRGKEGEIVAASFFEVVESTVVNGFGIGARLAPDWEVVRATLELHRSLFARLGAGFGIDEAEEQSYLAGRILGSGRFDPRTYLSFVGDHTRLVRDVSRRVASGGPRGDAFGASRAAALLVRASRARDAGAAAVAHQALLNKLDSHLTMLQLEQGDPADILFNVRWQADLYRTSPVLAKLECREPLGEASDQFVEAYGRREARNADYPDLIRHLFDCFWDTAKSLRRQKLQLEEDIRAMEQAMGRDDLAALQRAHRAMMLKLHGLNR